MQGLSSGKRLKYQLIVDFVNLYIVYFKTKELGAMTGKDLVDYAEYLREKTGKSVNLMKITEEQIEQFKSDRVSVA